MNLLRSCSFEVEDNLHYLLHCRHFLQFCNDLMNSVKFVSDNFESSSDKVFKNAPLHGDSSLNKNKIDLF